MGKGSGGTLVITPYKGTVERARERFSGMIASGEYDVARSYLSPSGGSLLFSKEHNIVKEEIEAGRILADKGYEVVLTPEGTADSVLKMSKRGGYRFPEGTISLVSFEQKTPNPGKRDDAGRAQNVKKALDHAAAKGAEIALIYDKNKALHRQDIGTGMGLFEKRSDYRFKAVVTINAKGEIHEWYHDQ